MSSDGKPLWGFRKIFFMLGIGSLAIAYWFSGVVHNPTEAFLRANPAGSANYIFQIATIPALIGLGVVYLWFWMQLRAQRFTPLNWRLGIGLLTPCLIFAPFGPLFIVNWCSKLCREHFLPGKTIQGDRI